MNVLGAFVGNSRDNLGVVSDLVRHIKDCDSVFIISVADISSVVLGVWATVDNTLCVVNVMVGGSTSGGFDVVEVRGVEENDASVAWHLGKVSDSGSNVTCY